MAPGDPAQGNPAIEPSVYFGFPVAADIALDRAFEN
jgi:hypothetical protein